MRLALAVRGTVQGVGFRPFVYRLARELGLAGWVSNSPQGALIEVEGPPSRVERFRDRLEAERPTHCVFHSLEARHLDPTGHREFVIRPSSDVGPRTALVLPDIATCAACLQDLRDPANRRFRYPFTNCTHCGPRFSILEALPYDRANTSMRGFALCARCRAEYDDPADRRFHAQPNACPDCGPHLAWWDAAGHALATREAALQAALDALRDGAIVAVKGLGGFHLMVAAGSDAAVRRLRVAKRREEKPFAVMCPDLAWVGRLAQVAPAEARVLRSPEAPIVLLERRRAAGGSVGTAEVAEAVAPGNPCLGVMLPYTPLHHLLLADYGAPVVATSGNVADEPICIDEREAVTRLAGLADFFLVHDRPIVRHVDDSIVRVLLGRELVMRRARGFAPLPLPLPGVTRPLLAVGAHLKNTVALAFAGQVFLSQHIGDLETLAATRACEGAMRDLQALYGQPAEAVAADAHPDYRSTRLAERTKLPLVSVQHHHAHVLACMVENEASAPLLGVAWDGTGHGLDGTIWGGEFLLIDGDSFRRVAHLRPFRLPGGERAIREPRRAAVGLLFEALGDGVFARTDLETVGSFTPAELKTLRRLLRQGVHSPYTTSAGRLFDALAALLGLRQVTYFEGQAAMDLEFAFDLLDTEEGYRIEVVSLDAAPAPDAAEGGPAGERSGRPWVLDWQPMVESVLADMARGVAVWEIAQRIHVALADTIVRVVERVGEPRVALSGGCFQNRHLLERTVTRLKCGGFQPYWHQRVPPNDGGIALGQAAVAARVLAAR